MLKTLIGLVQLARSVPVFEFVGTGLIVAGVYLRFGLDIALMVAGALLLLKSLDLALAEQPKDR